MTEMQDKIMEEERDNMKQTDTSRSVEKEEALEILNYYKGKDIVKADRLLLTTARNNFEAGKQEGIKQGKAQEQERTTKDIDKRMAYLKEQLRFNDNLDENTRNQYYARINELKELISRIKERNHNGKQQN